MILLQPCTQALCKVDMMNLIHIELFLCDEIGFDRFFVDTFL